MTVRDSQASKTESDGSSTTTKPFSHDIAIINDMPMRPKPSLIMEEKEFASDSSFIRSENGSIFSISKSSSSTTPTPLINSLIIEQVSDKDDKTEVNMDDEVDVEDCDDAGSEIGSNASSTVRYEQEPYDTFKDKVIKLFHDIGFGEPTAIERMKGGAFHRVIGLRFDSREVQDYVLRIPREAYEDKFRYETFNQVAILQYASQLDSIPTAKIFAYDTTTKNAIGSQYVLQQRLPGKPMCEVFETAPVSDKLQVINLVTELVAKLDRATLPHPGQIVGKGVLPDFSSTPLPPPKEPKIVGYLISPDQDLPLIESQNLVPLLVSLLKAHNEVDGAWMTPRYEKLQTVAMQMEEDGLTRKSDNENVVWLWDLAPQNILLSRSNESPEPKWEITGVIDWDEVLSVPRIFARKPPSWLWIPSNTRPNEWMGDLDDHPGRELTDNELLIKARFDQEMARLAPSYIEDAYCRGVWLRQVAKIAIKGFEDSNDYDRLDQLFEDWEKYYRSLGFVEDEGDEGAEAVKDSENEESDADTDSEGSGEDSGGESDGESDTDMEDAIDDGEIGPGVEDV